MKALIGESKVARVMALFGLALAVCLGLLGSSQQAAAGVPANSSLAPNNPLNKVEKRVLDDTANGKSTQFLVLMTEQANVAPGYDMTDQDARGWYVYNTLKATADRTQADLKGMLTKKGVAFKSYWAVNMLLVTGNRSLVETIAARPDVGKLEPNASFKGIDDPVNGTNAPITYDNPHAVEWGVTNVNAPQVWAMGFTGQNIVVGNQDTGMRWTHNAIKPKYRGWDGTTANHNYNWWDSIHTGGGACGANSLFPCDDTNHGTHTTGITVGDDSFGNQIGVAPGAKWMGCRNMDQGNGTPATYTECFQFFIAPTDLTGNNPNPALRPHVMNNSWGCPVSEGCAADTLRTIVENTQASGIFVEASAGNAGSGCSTVNDPPAIYDATFSTGAIDIGNGLASFSSRGPVTLDGSGRMKPNLSAPGVNNRSSVNNSDTAYASFSGTSMAGPHVVGVVALLWSAHPELSRNIAATKNLLMMTANPQVNVTASQPYCGNTPPSQIPNNYFGYGRVDALAAVNNAGPTATPCASCTNTPTRTGTPTPNTGGGYTYTTATGTIVAGTTDTGNHTDDGVTSITLPFSFTLYGTAYTSASVASNGNLQFTTTSVQYINECLPSTSITGPAIMPFWEDFRTDTTGTCTPGPCGIYTSVSGNAPNRIFNIEWRVYYYTGTGNANFEIRLYEASPSHFDVVIGTIDGTNNSETIGVQDGAARFTQYLCNTAVNNNTLVAFTSGGGTPIPTNTPGGNTPTPTPCSSGGGWAVGVSLPSAHVRAVGVWYANGLNRFYVMGGRSSDTAGSDQQNPRYFDPATNTWTVDTAASFPDNQVNNMACGDLNAGGHRIYCVGGSAAGATTSSSAVRMYDPVAHTMTVLTTDAWPVTDTLPGGFAVVNNKLYIVGGYILNVSMSRQIWQFDPNGAAGARWTLKTAQVPDPVAGSNGLGYIPAAAIGNVIYTAGGSFWDPNSATIADDVTTFSYDTTTDTVNDTAVPNLASPGSAETRALNVGGKVWLIGGGRTAPNPSASVMQFDPTNPGAGWTTVNAFTGARRNFPVDVDPASGKVYLAGGYMPTAATDGMQIYTPAQSCGTATRTPTPAQNTPTRTNTSGPGTATFTRTPTRTNTPGGQNTPTRTITPVRTNTPQRTITPCAGCNMEMLAVVTSCYLDGTVHWIAIVHNPDPCGANAPWRAELQVRNNGGSFRTVRIQYATSYFGSGDSIWDGFFCYHFSNNVRDVRVEYLFEDQDGVSRGSIAQVQERAAPPNSYSTTPDSGIPTAKSKSGNHNPNSPAACDADMASVPMAPCSSTGTCSGPPTPLPTGVATRVAPILPNK